ncbi:MAG: YiiD C-terminal domain-containing protein [Alphaproteobacteria bacterium]|nr:YiiD C-terminal domain-containing protein [Alphaproteobacteria bacterium]
MLPALDRTLRSVPMLSTLGIRAEEARTGHLVLRLPLSEQVTNHAGAIHSAAIFAVGELAAAVVLGTHPDLANLVHLQKSTRIKYYLPSTKDVTAHATVTSEMLDRVKEGLRTNNAHIEVPVKVLDGHGRDVAEVLTHFAFRQRR